MCKYDEFFDQLFPENKINNLITSTEIDDIDLVKKRVNTYIEEAKFGFNRIEKYLDYKNKNTFKILELGAGAYIVSAYLTLLGFNVTALEPVGAGFDFFSKMQELVLDYCKEHNIYFQIIKKEAEKVELTEKYNFIFSINSFEHFKEPIAVLKNLPDILQDNGKIFIHCPNYIIPYEPHLGIIFFPFGKKFNEFIYKDKIMKKQKIWNSLNFIKYSEIKKFAQAHKFKLCGNKNMIFDSFNRFNTDPEFKKRTPAIFSFIHNILIFTGLIKMFKLIPVCYQSPMELVLTPINQIKT